MKIVIDENIPYAYELFTQFGDVNLLSGRAISCRVLKKVDALIVRSVTTVDASLLFDSQVKFVGTVTSGVDHVDQDYLSSASIMFASSSGCNAIAVVEYVLTALLWLAKRDNFFLHDKVVGIIGVGNIGSCLYQRLKSFGVSTLLCDPFVEKNSDCMRFYALEKLVSEADILTFHVPLTRDVPEATWHMVNSDLLAALPNHCILINTSRGSVFDNLALLQVLKRGKNLSVVLDVWENEPALLFPLLKYVDLGTPHIAGATFEGKIRGIIQIFDAYKKFFFVDNEDMYYVPIPFLQKYFFKISKYINQEILFCLSNFLYNIYLDDTALRCNREVFNIFDILRQNYSNRREWSAIYIDSPNIFYAKKFKNLGFSICIDEISLLTKIS